MPKLTIAGRPLFNSSGDVDLQSTGYQYIIDSLTYIRDKVIKQKFFELSVPDYIPMDVGEAAWRSEIVQNLEFVTGGTFVEGITDQGFGKTPEVGSALAQIRMPTRLWAKKATWSIAEISEAANANWDVVDSRMRALKKNWDLGIQEGAFNGFDASLTGFLNNADVNINTSLITEEISGMSDTEFQAFVKGLLTAYFANSNYTRDNPDTFVMPASDYLGLASAASATFPNISKLEYLENSLKRMTRNDGFKILPCVYSQSAKNPAAKDRYVLYRNDPETLKMSIPVDFTMNQAYTNDGLVFQQKAYGQISGVLVNRPREVLYLDLTAST